MSAQDSLPYDRKVEVLRRNAGIFYGAVAVTFEHESVKQHADILNGAADEIEELRLQIAKLERSNRRLRQKLDKVNA